MYYHTKFYRYHVSYFINNAKARDGIFEFSHEINDSWSLQKLHEAVKDKAEGQVLHVKEISVTYFNLVLTEKR